MSDFLSSVLPAAQFSKKQMVVSEINEAFKPLENELWEMVRELRIKSEDTLHSETTDANLMIARAWASLIDPVRKAIDRHTSHE